MSEFSFPKSLRLLSPADYKQVFRNAKRFSNNKITLYVTPNNKSHPRVGFVITKKKIKHSVDRNKLKRICRESFRLQQQTLPSVDIVVMPRTKLDQVDGKEIHNSLENLWVKLQKAYSGS